MAKRRARVAADITPREGSANRTHGGGPDAETRAVASHPDFQSLVAKARLERERGEGTSAEEFFHDLGLPLDPAEDERAPEKNGASR